MDRKFKHWVSNISPIPIKKQTTSHFNLLNAQNKKQNKRQQHHWGKADESNCNYVHPKMVDVE